jgi:hypothetical protein
MLADFSEYYDIIAQLIELFMTTAVRTSNPAWKSIALALCPYNLHHHQEWTLKKLHGTY